MKSKRYFISFEGIDGCGKTTQVKMLEHWLLAKNFPVHVTREPGGTLIGQQIRSILLNPKNHQLIPQSEILLYLADRLQHLHELILPIQDKHGWLICDRFHDATLAYQGYGRGLDLSALKTVIQQWIEPYLPDLTFLLTLAPQLAIERIAQRNQTQQSNKEARLDQESLAFFEKVAQGYREIAQQAPERVVIVDATQSPQNVHQTIQEILTERQWLD